MAGKRSMKWDAAAHEDLLISMAKHCDLGGHTMARLLEDMHCKGYTFTENAFRYDIDWYSQWVVLCILSLPCRLLRLFTHLLFFHNTTPFTF